MQIELSGWKALNPVSVAMMLVTPLVIGNPQSSIRIEAAMEQSSLFSPIAISDSAQAKITYLGEQSKPIASVVFHTANMRPDMKIFAHIDGPSNKFSNDDSPYTATFAVSSDEFTNILTALQPILSGSRISEGPDYLSFTVQRNNGGTSSGGGFRIGPSFARRFYTAVLSGIDRHNDAGKQAVLKQFQQVNPI